MKSKLMAVLLAGSFLAAGSACANSYTDTYQESGYKYIQSGQLQAAHDSPEMDPNFLGLVVPLGRIFGTWIIRNHKYVWMTIVGVLAFPEELGDGTLDDDYPPDFYSEEEADMCKVYFEFDDAGGSGQGGDYDDDYELTDKEMDYLDWFCGNYSP